MQCRSYLFLKKNIANKQSEKIEMKALAKEEEELIKLILLKVQNNLQQDEKGYYATDESLLICMNIYDKARLDEALKKL